MASIIIAPLISMIFITLALLDGIKAPRSLCGSPCGRKRDVVIPEGGGESSSGRRGGGSANPRQHQSSHETLPNTPRTRGTEVEQQQEEFYTPRQSLAPPTPTPTLIQRMQEAHSPPPSPVQKRVGKPAGTKPAEAPSAEPVQFGPHGQTNWDRDREIMGLPPAGEPLVKWIPPTPSP